MDDKLDEEAESLGVLKSPNQTPPNSWQLWNITNSKTVQPELIGAPCSFLPQCGHGDDGVPKGGRDGGEGGVLNVLFTVKHDGGEDDDGHGQGEHQEAQL